MPNAKLVSLRARPWRGSQLCFEVGGTLGQLSTQLGATVTAFDFPTFYGGLGATAAGDPSLLVFNSQAIMTNPKITTSMLAALRAESMKAALDKTVNARQNAYFAKYGNIAGIVAEFDSSYGTGTTAKPQRLQNLATLAQQQADQLAAAYKMDGRNYVSGSVDGKSGVVRNTNSTLQATTKTTDAASSSGSSTSTTTPNLTTTSSGQTVQEEIGAPNFTGVGIGAGAGGSGTDIFPLPPAKGAPLSWQITGGNQDQSSLTEGTSGETSVETGTSTGTESGRQTSTGSAYAVETENIVNTDYDYRMPSIESQAQNERAQISLIDQEFAQFMTGQTLSLYNAVPSLTRVLNNEANSIDASVYQLQVGLLNTILLSPIDGVVTGIYKNPGDPVRAGEPVLRVEDNRTLLLVGRLIYRGKIQANSTTVTVNTNLFDASGPQQSLTGLVVAVRSGGQDDLWDLVVQCLNPLDTSNVPIFPIGYDFDYDPSITTVSIT